MKDYNKLTDEDGFLFDPDEWTKEFAIKSVIDLDINLANDHWLVIDMIRDHLFRHYCQVCKALESFDRKVT